MRMNYEDIYEIILCELDKINKIESAKLIAQTPIEMNTIEYELSKHRWKAYNYLILFNTMVDDEKSPIIPYPALFTSIRMTGFSAFNRF